MVNVKKRLIIPALSVFVISILSNLVSAYFYFDAYSIENFIQNVINGMTAVASPVLTGVFGGYVTSDFFFAKVLVFILLFVVIKVAVRATPRLGENRTVVNIIALIVAILAVRYMNETDFFKGILLPYGVLGVVLTTMLPFMIYFYFVHQSMASGSGRRLAFIFFLVVFGIMWASRASDLSDLNNYIYLATLILCICALLFDGQIKRYFKQGEINKIEESVNVEHIAKTVNELDAAMNARSHAVATNDTKSIKLFDKLIEGKRRQLRKFGLSGY